MTHYSHDVPEILPERGRGDAITAGLTAAVAVIVILSVLAMAVLFSRPWG